MTNPLRALPLFLLLAACGPGGPGASGQGGTRDAGAEGESLAGALEKREAPRVRVAPVLRKEMVRRLTTTTAIESVREVELQPRTGGVVTELLVEEGDMVQAGQVLARIDPRDAEAALRDAEVALLETQNQGPKLDLAVDEAAERIESAQLALAQAERDVAANEKAGLISKNELQRLMLARDQALRDLATARLTLEQAKADRDAHGAAVQRAQLKVDRESLNLSYTALEAPFAGVIAERMINVGATVSSGMGAFRLTDAENVRAVVFRPQRELAFFTGAMAGGGDGGIAIEVRPDALPGELYQGQIQIVSPTIDATSGSFRLTIGLQQPELDSGRPRLLPGMLVRLSIVTERRPDSLAVPKRALRREGERRFLFAVRAGKAVRVDVEEGLADDDEVQVLPLAGFALEPEEPVVVVGNRDLEDGQEVLAEPWLTEGNPAPEAPEPEPEEAEEAPVAAEEPPAKDEAPAAEEASVEQG